MKSECAERSPVRRATPRRTPRTPRYEEIYRQLVGDIRDGRYPVGGKLPPELELCATFGASRHTVRDAVRRLTEQGLIARRAGAGTMVLRRTRSRGFTQQISAIPRLAGVREERATGGARGAGHQGERAGGGLASVPPRPGLAPARCAQAFAQGEKPVAYVLAFVHRDHPALRGGARPARRARCMTSSRSGSASGSSPSSRSCPRSRSWARKRRRWASRRASRALSSRAATCRRAAPRPGHLDHLPVRSDALFDVAEAACSPTRPRRSGVASIRHAIEGSDRERRRVMHACGSHRTILGGDAKQ